ncbi:MAG: alanine racemase [Xylophilus ampelinus]
MLKRPNVFRIDLNAVADCTRELRALIGPGRPFIATLKANGYGYGVLPVALTVLQNGADALSLSNPKDAVCLRRAGIEVPILVYAGVIADAESVALHEQYALMPSLHDEASFAGFARHLRAPLRVAVKVDIGPERLGVPMSRAEDFIRRVHAHPRMRLHAVHAHPNVRHDEGEGARECMEWQHARFARLHQALAAGGIDVPWFGMASSKALKVGGASMAMGAADPGQALFSSLSGGTAQAFSQLRTCLLAVRTVERTEHFGQAPFPMRAGMRIGILPIGYADGMHRVHAGGVLVRGQRVPLVGRPALEYTRIDLDRVPGAQVGDEVVLVGRQGDAAIPPEEACAFQGAARVIDLALEIGPSVQREYVHL